MTMMSNVADIPVLSDTRSFEKIVPFITHLFNSSNKKNQKDVRSSPFYLVRGGSRNS
jgi:hypothetical protein